MAFSERDFVDWVADLVDEERNLLGHDDDAVAIALGDQYLVINIDGWVASSDRPEGLSAHDCGFRAVANAVSDVIAKGARPEGMIISMSVSDEYKNELKQFILGFNTASRLFEVPYLGGDINSSEDLVIDVTVWGRTDRIIPRSGASPGDEIYWLGPSLGSTSAALGILTQNWEGDKEKALAIMGRPELYPEFLSINASASIDSSDGLARSLHLLSRASDVGIQLINLAPSDLWIEEVAAANNQIVLDLILYGGEELGIVFTVEKGTPVDHATKIGEITKVDGVYYRDQHIPDRGWDHFAL